MSKFSLLQELENPQSMQDKEPSYGIKYQEYEIVVEGQMTTINIPLRVSEQFESEVATELSEQSGITRTRLNEILRQYRGIMG